MIRVNTIPAFCILPVVLCLLLCGTGAGTSDSFTDSLKLSLEKYNNNFNEEKTYILTDRYVYRPGDDLWFKGFVTSGRNINNPNSKDLFIKLFSSRGEEIIFRRYPLSENQASGRLLVPRSAIPGKYWLVAYTGWMKNQCPREAFRKEILVSRYFEKRFLVEVLYDKSVYSAHDTMNAVIKITDPAGRPISGTGFDYTIGTFKKSEVKGSEVTDIKGKAKISCVLPHSDDILLFTVEIRSRKLSGDYSLIIPCITGDPVIAFSPEGGSLVVGLKCNMAFKVTNSYGLPVIVSGLITNSKGEFIHSVYSNSDGLGSFEYVPGTDTCYFHITNPTGPIKKYALPYPGEKGTVIHLTDLTKDSAVFFVHSSDNKPQKTYWIGVMDKKIVLDKIVDFTQNARVALSLKDLESGVMQISVFDQNYLLSAERLIQIKNNSRELAVKLERQVYQARKRVSVLVEYPDNLINSNVAMAVSLNNLAWNRNMPDFNALVNSNPCSSVNSGPRLSDLSDDLALLTTDYRIIDWSEVLTAPPGMEAYKSQDGLTGKVLDKKNNISQHAKVRVTHFPNFRLYETQTDENGKFSIEFGSDIIDYKYLNIDAYDAPGKTSLSASVDYGYAEVLRKVLLKESENTQLQKVIDLDTYGEPDLVYVLRYGPGKFRKSKTDVHKKYDPYQYTNYTDVMDIIQDIQPYRLSGNKIIFIDSNRNKPDTASMNESIIVINGVLKGTDARFLMNLVPSDITNINISNSLLDVHKYTPLSFSGVIEITTIQGMYRYRQSHVQVGPNFLAADREFYSPDYSVESVSSADNRKTLYWNPRISLNQGKSVLITFYTSDVKGLYYGHITGMDNEGNPVEAHFNFRVE